MDTKTNCVNCIVIGEPCDRCTQKESEDLLQKVQNSKVVETLHVRDGNENLTYYKVESEGDTICIGTTDNRQRRFYAWKMSVNDFEALPGRMNLD